MTIGRVQGRVTSMVASNWDPELRIINKFIHVSIMFSKSW